MQEARERGRGAWDSLEGLSGPRRARGVWTWRMLDSRPLWELVGHAHSPAHPRPAEYEILGELQQPIAPLVLGASVSCTLRVGKEQQEVVKGF